MNKAQAHARCREIVAAHEDGDTIEHDELAFVQDVFMTHPKAQEKLAGSTVAVVSVGRNRFGTRCFYVHTADGRKDDFSVKKCGAVDGY